MAGIGFRLKRLIAEESYGGWLRAHLYGAVVSSGPWLLSVFTLAALALLSRETLRSPALEIFRSTVIYCYTFSLITTGGVQMVVTRHLADALYLGDESVLAGSFRWTIGATALGHLALGGAFFGLAPGLSPVERIAAVLLFVVVGCTWIAMIFLGAAQDYASVILAFFVGNAVSLAGALLLGGSGGPGGYLAGFVLGQAAIFFVLAARIEREFPAAGRPEGRFLLRSFRRYPDLVAAGLFYNAAIAVDRIVFWISPAGFGVGSWFYASRYDAPLFLAYVSVVPSLAFFLVSIETGFYDRYRQYYGVVTKHGTLRQVLEAKRVMALTLRDSLGRLLLVQGPVTLSLMIGAPWTAAAMGMGRIQVGILRAALVGAALHALALFGIIVLLYFDRRRAAVEVALLFLAGNAGLTAVTLWLGPGFYGFGYPVAALCACAWAYRRLEATFENLEYLTFASQPMSPDPGLAA
ncbi:MAG: hypothetical protein A2X52_22490 [Candidatus Rokubacteria bacterium GWC2_70_16]|nr:MAG: hypothetical protein A2X52_22490 [Candidatus Rokubacteria bacterium GWC2_70_16]OGL18020.1 MAG: hypothetical protein A3K12_03700 [Candidatus Rokubacteria bacterium RIFCSPLOWO2_12_FULL_71_19]